MRWMAILTAAAAFGQSWSPQQSNTTASLRGVMAVSPAVVWASGAKGTFLRTLDGGTTWKSGRVAGAADADFRGLWAFDENSAVLLSAGDGEKSRVYKTSDGGEHWELLYTNPDPAGYFDAVAFWDESHGILLGDPVKGRFVILTTSDGGVSWTRQKGPPALPKEGAFAASNSCLAIRGGPGVAFDRRRPNLVGREDAHERRRDRGNFFAGLRRRTARRRRGRRLSEARRFQRKCRGDFQRRQKLECARRAAARLSLGDRLLRREKNVDRNRHVRLRCFHRRRQYVEAVRFRQL